DGEDAYGGANHPLLARGPRLQLGWYCRLDRGKRRRVVNLSDASCIKLAAKIEIQLLLKRHGALQTLEFERERRGILVLAVSRKKVTDRVLRCGEVARR